MRLFDSALYVKSVFGEGSEFYFTLQLALHVESTTIVETTTDHIKDLTGLRVLVAEDNNVNMLVLRNFLKKWNVTPDEATNGAEALAKFNSQEYDVILLDIEMPVLDGYTAIKEIRKMDADIPVVAFTAAFYDDMQNDLLARGFNDHLHKPLRRMTCTISSPDTNLPAKMRSLFTDKISYTAGYQFFMLQGLFGILVPEKKMAIDPPAQNVAQIPPKIC